MKIQKIMDIGKAYRLNKIIQPSGMIFTLDARKDESADNDIDHALKLLNS